MPLPKYIREHVQASMTEFCDVAVPEEHREEKRVGFHIRSNAVTLYEERPHFEDRAQWIQIPVAQFRYNHKTMEWILYCADRNSRWHDYEAGPTKNIRSLLQEVERDITGIFWG